ncbi:hypothetical protein JXB27_02760 [Candidatus Woesearchaeota archaeon]|nr:hypothetical protein [Candidatus Woesearchaeota archaeon]
MIQQKVPDKKNAISIIQSAKKDMDFTLTLEINDLSASTIIRNIYECFRMLGEALLMIKGFKSKDHIEPINELLKVQVNTSRPIALIDNLRKTRHNINYYGYSPKKEEAEDAVSLAKNCFEPLFNEVKKKAN